MKKRGFAKKLIGSAVIMALAITGLTIPQPTAVQAAEDYYVNNWRDTVTVHDPSIVVGYEKDGKILGKEEEGSTKIYFVFGSHLAFAKSYDLQNWEMIQNNICTDYDTLFKVGYEWSKIGDPTYSLVPPNEATNIWAPDVIWNEDMGKWCMYMTVNGRSWDSSICLLTADTLDGDWTYIDTVVYSGFTDKAYGHDYTLTDYQKVTGDTELADRYIGNPYTPAAGCDQSTWNTDYGAHAIDPCVLYDDEGNLWMTYGSWSGGIYMIGLDEATGLRDYNQKYETVANTSDAYMGIQLGGGYFASGEAPYIQKIGDYYYLFITYGGLASTGGYNVRCFRSDKITGPYVDDQGNSAIYTARTALNTNGSIGQRMMAYCQWSWQSYGELAQGHNSAFVDTDGKAYIIYHTRALYCGEEHKLRVHQLYQNENGWLVESPARYTGETIKEDGYSMDEIVGTYEVILHKATAFGSKEVNVGVDITLNANGTVVCPTDKSYVGSWMQTDGSYYMTIVMGDTTYHGVFASGVIEGSDNDETICFTAVADETGSTNSGICAWGIKLSPDLTSYIEGSLKMKNAKVSIPKGASKKLKVWDTVNDDKFLKKAVWKSSNTKIATVNANGKVTAKKVGSATITATVGNKSMTCKVTVTKKTAKKK